MIAGDLETGYDDKKEGSNAGEKKRDLRIEPHQNRRQHSASKHRDHVLDPHRDELHKRKFVFGIVDLIQGPSVRFVFNLDGHSCCSVARKAILGEAKTEVQDHCSPVLLAGFDLGGETLRETPLNS